MAIYILGSYKVVRQINHFKNQMTRLNTNPQVERQLLRLLHNHTTRHNHREIHAHFLRHNLHSSNQLLSHFISILSSSNKITYATCLFNQSPNPNILTFNSIIKAYSLFGPHTESISVFLKIKARGVFPNEFTFAPLLKSCAEIGDVGLGFGVYKEVLVMGFGRFVSIGIGFVEFCVSCGRMEDAVKVFDAMSERNVVLWNLMVRGFCRVGDLESGLRFFKGMGVRSVVSWNTMIGGLAKGGDDEGALGIFREMLEDGVEGDEVTVVTVLPVCGRLGDVGVGERVRVYAEKSGLLRESVPVGNALVDFYCKCGDLERGVAVFNDMKKRNVVSWNSVIAGCGFNGKGEIGVGFFEEMVTVNRISPNHSTFVAVLACCVHAGLLQRGRDLFASMVADFNLEPKLEHYGCMVDLLGRSACIKEAYDLINTMPMKPNAALWGALLSACRANSEMELAEHAVKELINLEPWNSGNYVLLSNIYAETSNWSGVQEVRTLMKNNCVNKTVGQSMVG